MVAKILKLSLDLVERRCDFYRLSIFEYSYLWDDTVYLFYMLDNCILFTTSRSLNYDSSLFLPLVNWLVNSANNTTIQTTSEYQFEVFMYWSVTNLNWIHVSGQKNVIQRVLKRVVVNVISAEIFDKAKVRFSLQNVGEVKNSSLFHTHVWFILNF